MIENSGSLLSNKNMGGITGGKGYHFQNQYIAAKLPEWLEQGLEKVFIEGTGDVDIRFLKAESIFNLHVQVKDHSVAPAEFKDVLEHFETIAEKYTDTSYHFLLATPGLGKDLQPLANALVRLREAAPFFGENGDDLGQTHKDIQEILKKIELGEKYDFIGANLYFDSSLMDYHDVDKARAVFAQNLGKIDGYVKRPHGALAIAYSEVFTLVANSSGKVLSRGQIESCISKAIESQKNPENKTVITIHNWTKEVFPASADYEIDWSTKFDRDTRKVPSTETWGQFRVELIDLKKKILNIVSGREILFQGKVTLTTGIMLGQTFPQNGGWTIHVEQPQMKEVWSSSEMIDPNFIVNSELVSMDSTNGDSIVLVCDITGRGVESVRKTISEQNIKAHEILRISPSRGEGSISIKNNSEAVTFALQCIDNLRERITKTGIRKTEIFFYGPISIAIFLGQRLTSLGDITLYEFQDPGYAPSITFRS